MSISNSNNNEKQLPRVTISKQLHVSFNFMIRNLLISFWRKNACQNKICPKKVLPLKYSKKTKEQFVPKQYHVGRFWFVLALDETQNNCYIWPRTILSYDCFELKPNFQRPIQLNNNFIFSLEQTFNAFSYIENENKKSNKREGTKIENKNTFNLIKYMIQFSWL